MIVYQSQIEESVNCYRHTFNQISDNYLLRIIFNPANLKT